MGSSHHHHHHSQDPNSSSMTLGHMVQKAKESSGDVTPKKYNIFLASKPVDGDRKWLDVTNKYTNDVAAKVPQATHKDIDDAIDAAVAAAPAMAAMGAYERKAVLEKVVAELKNRFEEIAQTLTMESGKPIKDARGEVTRTIDTFQVAAEESVRIYGEHIPLDISARNKGLQGIVKKFPIGPVSMVSPWNFPLNLVAHKVAPAIAVGCPFVLKPASRTPLSALILGEILHKIEELPLGAFSILPVSREDADMFTVDERFKLLTFTGSGPIGWDMKARAGKKKVVMELGGNAPCIVDDYVPDLDYTIQRLINGGFYQGGQSCIHMQRLYVHERLYDEVKEGFVAAVKKLKMGNPFEEDTYLGPMISESAAKGIEDWVKEAVAKGGKLLTGGNRKGAFIEPTVIEDVPIEANARKEEIFGPVVLLYKYSDFKEAVKECNNTHYGLQSGIFTKDLNKAFYAFEHMEVGGVILNDSPALRVDSQPYGGLKDSGIQREGVKYAMDDMLETKVLVMRNVGTL
uniref:ALDH21) n=1 Tax=Physcomitrium patens TaxID=3218 RepID=UPI000B90A7CB|nr:Chain A, ALDH21) [Physcomitrium patens]5MZ5_B Chain B, ALDH21) [Physcomitrium patens]5MZ5_C Chain C, ALDH21) [Physcomitrium patens]5MZ5_D Chain D, ALDH21) [Physcomitrium patens]5MZ8_A Chain A, aldehyde dehydrogenase 21 [Physcomitrium patens]5MZ8_B Chain B, aldehyde dehydrogenase 21 [Physcomitrium patens]5MZ8_C Chain C, aldehyde dehydrogenase 21 [Physcomitrium patens]5MZ8_D Chain D, aldehyde dehydrogenase 21 [Physcomitrium patens]5N5S_A Chain A, Aldehyde dehydrogenase 21 (ALDH21) [Physcom